MERKLIKTFLEITNVCNASCSFCPGHKRRAGFISKDEFVFIADRLEGRVEQLYFHLMGEPLLHPDICDFAEIAAQKGFRVMVTTNGILSSEVGQRLISGGNVYRVSISLHSYEANGFGISFKEYLDGCFSLAMEASRAGTYAVLRLWNLKEDSRGKSDFNATVLESALKYFGKEPVKTRSGYRVYDRVFIEYGERFDWPTQSNEQSEEVFCYGLRDQIGILCDGTVVPCCLDSEGELALGNIFTQTLDEILSADRARAIYDGFTSHRPAEELCKKCGFAPRFSR